MFKLLFGLFGLLVGGPALLLILLAITRFRRKQVGQGVWALLAALVLLGVLVFKLCNPEWTIQAHYR